MEVIQTFKIIDSTISTTSTRHRSDKILFPVMSLAEENRFSVVSLLVVYSVTQSPAARTVMLPLYDLLNIICQWWAISSPTHKN
jgi:hypothetical protein